MTDDGIPPELIDMFEVWRKKTLFELWEAILLASIAEMTGTRERIAYDILMKHMKGDGNGK